MAEENRYESLFPDVAPPSPEDELAATEASADAAQPRGVIVTQQVTYAFGRSWAFDFVRGRFVGSDGGGPVTTEGDATLRTWIEKALRTPRLGATIYADGHYGCDETVVIGERPIPQDVARMQSRYEEALLVHPRITGITDWKFQQIDEVIDVSFTVLTDEEPLLIALETPSL